MQIKKKDHRWKVLAVKRTCEYKTITQNQKSNYAQKDTIKMVKTIQKN